jgi:hypothetical protein
LVSSKKEAIFGSSSPARATARQNYDDKASLSQDEQQEP